MLPEGKLLVLPCRIVGIMESETGEQYYRVEVYGQKDKTETLVLRAHAESARYDSRTWNAAVAGETHPQGWPK